ncbi:hypothetical protein [Pandoraea sp. NPDC087047]|uniref:hypothetical protein n=1 Tax=Pandoraea sp. NPDC087047 TaxID=3364390 RepID=UPI0037FAC7A5
MTKVIGTADRFQSIKSLGRVAKAFSTCASTVAMPIALVLSAPLFALEIWVVRALKIPPDPRAIPALLLLAPEEFLPIF